MKRILFVTMVFGLLGSLGLAQKTYVGVGLSVPIAFGIGTLPLLGVQVGSEVAENIEVRGTLETLILGSFIGVDGLYTALIPESTARWYAGGGAKVLFILPVAEGGAGRLK